MLQVLQEKLDHVPVKASQVMASSHHSHFEAQLSQETSYLDSHIPTANHQSLSRLPLHPEDIVAGDAEFAVFALVFAEIGGPGASCYNNLVGFDEHEWWLLPVFYLGGRQFLAGKVLMNDGWVPRTEDGVGIDQRRQSIDVLDSSFLQIGLVAKIERSDVGSDLGNELFPGEFLDEFRCLFL